MIVAKCGQGATIHEVTLQPFRSTGSLPLSKIYDLNALDSEWYLKRYPDVHASGYSAEEHYSLYGKGEGRFANPLSEELNSYSNEFDGDWYLQRYQDVSEEAVDPLVHYVLYGREEGRHASERAEQLATFASDFDESWYIEMYPDVASSTIEPLKHYAQYGRFEGRFKNAKDHKRSIASRLEPFIRELYKLLLEREPSEDEILETAGHHVGDEAYVSIFQSIFYSDEAREIRMANRPANDHNRRPQDHPRFTSRQLKDAVSNLTPRAREIAQRFLAEQQFR